jgi:hypothetical protein
MSEMPPRRPRTPGPIPSPSMRSGGPGANIGLGPGTGHNSLGRRNVPRPRFSYTRIARVLIAPGPATKEVEATKVLETPGGVAEAPARKGDWTGACG